AFGRDLDDNGARAAGWAQHFVQGFTRRCGVVLPPIDLTDRAVTPAQDPVALAGLDRDRRARGSFDAAQRILVKGAQLAQPPAEPTTGPGARACALQRRIARNAHRRAITCLTGTPQRLADPAACFTASARNITAAMARGAGGTAKWSRVGRDRPAERASR